MQAAETRDGQKVSISFSDAKIMATIGEQAIKGSKSSSGEKVAKKPDERRNRRMRAAVIGVAVLIHEAG